MLIFLPRHQLFPYAVSVDLTKHKETGIITLILQMRKQVQKAFLKLIQWLKTSGVRIQTKVWTTPHANYLCQLQSTSTGSCLAQTLGRDGVNQISQGGTNTTQTCLQGEILGNKIRLLSTKSCGPFGQIPALCSSQGTCTAVNKLNPTHPDLHSSGGETEQTNF